MTIAEFNNKFGSVITKQTVDNYLRMVSPDTQTCEDDMGIFKGIYNVKIGKKHSFYRLGRTWRAVMLSFFAIKN